MRVLIAEDLALLRAGLARILAANGFEVVAELADGHGLAERIVEVRPDVSIVDVRLPPSFTDEGLRATLAARRAVPGLPILILSQFVEHVYATELLSDRSGGVGYLLKDRVGNVADFVDAVVRVADGGTALDPDVVAQLLAGTRQRARLAALTPREREVLAVMAEGRSNSAIAERLVVSDKAVSKHINNIFAKLDLPPSDEHHRRVLAVLTHQQESARQLPEPG
ncbi:two component transcriptional regulator, LuxR family [Jatrophihabitans endophyticus]|uniref:Two component transcriptional regulator, LuxR family n=1 Tax=Jatrophihabitans endophyticus TaxID=1206085 RepID=A0A1M5UMT6_9ACTN|nr:response regulator transcription factor [Jatrophihabitans endophyticus]SHH64342.1 two component transcriptional regulator, LuxR family [Jatrophihabitans endophyticus]